MDRHETGLWDGDLWEQEFDSLMEIARSHLRPEWKHGEVVVLKTTRGRIHVVEIPNFQDPTIREPLENRCIQTLTEENDTEVSVCFATANGTHPEILSWNFRSKLIELNKSNLEAKNFLWGGGEEYFLKPFSSLLPPKKY